MKRLTDKRLAIPPGQWQEVTREEARELKEIPVPSMRELYYRLSQIEDILCDSTDEYDLDRLRVLCNQRMTMREALKNVGRYIEWENGMEEYRGVPCYSYHRIMKVMADQYETRYITDDICPLANSKNIRRIVDAPPEV